MQVLTFIGQFFKIAGFFLNLWAEKDKKKRASRLNAAIGSINRLHGK